MYTEQEIDTNPGEIKAHVYVYVCMCMFVCARARVE